MVHDLAAHHTMQPQLANQSLNRATSHDNAFACKLPPHLVGAIDLHVGLPDMCNLWHQHLFAMSAGTALMWLAQQRHMPSICRRSDLQDLAERLDSEGITMLVDEGLQGLRQRSSSAWAKSALASFSISLACRSSLTWRSAP